MPKNGDFLSFFPLELRGFVIAALGVLLCFVLFQAFRFMKRPLGRAGGKAASGREKTAARDAALAAGFMVDEVERDMPDPGASGIAFLQRGSCARYQWPERIASSSGWALLRRPAESQSGLAPGWVLQFNRGTPGVEMQRVLALITADIGNGNDFLEIEIANNTLYFYWDERGGKNGVAKLKTYAEKIRDTP